MDQRLLGTPEALIPLTTTAHVRDKLQVLTAKPIVPQPAFEETVRRVAYGPHINIAYDSSPDKLTITGRQISVIFEKQKVIVCGAQDVFLFSSAGIRFTTRMRVEFMLDFVSGINAITWKHQKIFFRYGDALFILDQSNRVVKVWSHMIGCSLNGFVWFVELEPRPNLDLSNRLGPIRL